MEPGEPSSGAPERRTAGGDQDLRSRLGSGLRWSFAQQLGLRSMSMLSGIALARILAEADFGVYAIALAAVNIGMSVNDLSLGPALVRTDLDEREAARTAMTLAAAMSLFVYAVCFFAAPALASIAGAPHAVPVLRFLALIVLIDGIVTAPRGLMYRHFLQARLAKGELATIPITAAVSIALAVGGAGPWSLAGGMIAGGCANALWVLWSAPEIPGYGFELSAARSLLAFSIPLAGASLVEYTLLNVDYLIIGSHLGTTALGLYLLAFNVSSWPTTVLTQAIRRVSIASFARIEGAADRFVPAFSLLVRLTVLLCLGIAVLARPLIEVVYGGRWLGSVDALRLLATVGGVRVAVGFCHDLLAGRGRSRITLAAQLCWLGALVPLLYVLTDRDGIRGAATAHLLAAVLVAVPLFGLGLRRIGVPVIDVVRALIRPAIAAALAAGAGAGVLALVDDPALELAAGGVAIVVVYLAAGVGPNEVRRGGWRHLLDATPRAPAGRAPDHPEPAGSTVAGR